MSNNQFIKQFDCKIPEHVLWLKKMNTAIDNLMSNKTPITNSINNNPFGLELKGEEGMDWAQIHFALSMKYSSAVLEGNAFIPGYVRERPMSAKPSRSRK